MNSQIVALASSQSGRTDGPDDAFDDTHAEMPDDTPSVARPNVFIDGILFSPPMRVIAAALEQDREVLLQYVDAFENPTIRQVDPISLLHGPHGYLLRAFCRLRGGKERYFRVDRIWRAALAARDLGAMIDGPATDQITGHQEAGGAESGRPERERPEREQPHEATGRGQTAAPDGDVAAFAEAAARMAAEAARDAAAQRRAEIVKAVASDPCMTLWVMLARAAAPEVRAAAAAVLRDACLEQVRWTFQEDIDEIVTVALDAPQLTSSPLDPVSARAAAARESEQVLAGGRIRNTNRVGFFRFCGLRQRTPREIFVYAF